MSLKLIARILILSVLSLLIIGSALVLSASHLYSLLRFDSFYHLFNSHISKVILAVCALLAVSMIPYRYYKQYSKKLIVGTVFLLIITYIIAPDVKGAGRWINLYVISFQPSEIAKIVLIMHLAYLIEIKGKLLDNYKQGFMYPLIWIFIIAGLIFIQPNVSTSLLIVFTSFTVLFIGGAKLKHIFSSIAVTGVCAGFFMMLFSHSRGRILTFIDSFNNGGTINTQVTQAKIALGSGGVLGLGIGHSRQSDLFLPEAYGDFIFSILGEELGFIGAVFVLLVYLVMFVMGILVAKKARDRFAQLLAFGISFLIVINAFTNAAVVMGVFPTTGIPLPFISYGGTSIMFTCGAIGIIINIALETYKNTEKKIQAK